MYIQVLLLILGFIILVKGAEFIIDGAVSIANHFNISMFIISLIIVGFGTNLPEFMISIRSMIAGKSDIVFNNVIGIIFLISYLLLVSLV